MHCSRRYVTTVLIRLDYPVQEEEAYAAPKYSVIEEESEPVISNGREDDSRRDIVDTPIVDPRADGEIQFDIPNKLQPDAVEVTVLADKDEEPIKVIPHAKEAFSEAPGQGNDENRQVEIIHHVEKDLVQPDSPIVPEAIEENVKQTAESPSPKELVHTAKPPLSPVVEGEVEEKEAPLSARKSFAKPSFELTDAYLLDLRDTVDVLE